MTVKYVRTRNGRTWVQVGRPNAGNGWRGWKNQT
jgi:hypothetical protein